MLLDLPVARREDGPVTGPVRTEFIADEPGVACLPLSGRGSTRSHPAVSLDTAKASLTMRPYADAPRQPVPADEWSFARIEAGGGLDGLGPDWGVAPSDSHIFLPEGFRPGWIYELVYEGRDPLVMGLGHVAVRDLVSWLRYEEGVGNPLGGIDRAYGYGRSQTGRAIRDFVWRGFNADAAGRRVFDGLMPHVSGAGGKWLNQRFANAVVSGGQQHEDHYCPADRFPFAYSPCTDPHSGRSDAILKRPDTDPLIVHTQTATEYWQRRGSLVHTDCEGNDLAEPEGVRIYHWTGTQHSADPNQREPRRAVCENWLNVAQTSMLFRAMLDALDRWADGGPPPPPSRYPRIADGTLVPYANLAGAVPGDSPAGPCRNRPTSCRRSISARAPGEGILDNEPPEVLAEEGYPVLVPAVDADGNEIAGVRAPMIAAPVGTFAGWNIRRRGSRRRRDARVFGQLHPLPRHAGGTRSHGRPPPFPAGALRRCGGLSAGRRGGGADAHRGGLHAGGGPGPRARPRRRLGPAADRCAAPLTGDGLSPRPYRPDARRSRCGRRRLGAARLPAFPGNAAAGRRAGRKRHAALGHGQPLRALPMRAIWS